MRYNNDFDSIMDRLDDECVLSEADWDRMIAEHTKPSTMIKIPDNATNGEVIQTLFPNDVILKQSLMKSWWDAPYNGSEK